MFKGRRDKVLNNFDSDAVKSLTSNEDIILQYIISHKDEVIKMNINQLAQNTYVSTATISRLCHKLNLKGFSDLKFKLKSDNLHKNDLLSNNTLENKSSEINDIIPNSLKRLKNTVEKLNVEDLNYIVNCLCSDKNIHIFARGLTQMPLEYLSNTLLSLNRSSTFYIDPPLIYRAASRMTSNDIMIIGSSGGATIPIIKTAALSKSNSAIVIAITSDPSSELASIADITLYGEIERKDFFGIDINSRLSIQFIIEAILELYINKLKANNIL